MNIVHILKNSIALPKKETVYSLNRVSMRDTLIYIFLLILISSIPDIIRLFLTGTFSQGALKSVFYLQVFLFYPLYIIFIGVIGISLLAGIGTLIKQGLKRKLTYHHIWKMTAYAATLPLLLNTVEKVCGFNNVWINVILILLLFFYLYKMIVVYPVAAKKRDVKRN
ncbi:MAG: DUF1189 family protein [Tuberibacillus sp.]